MNIVEVSFDNLEPNQVAAWVKSFFNTEGYKLEEGTLMDGAYGKGSHIRRAILGGLAHRSKFRIKITPEQHGVRLLVYPGMRGWGWGGWWGHWRLQKAFDHIALKLLMQSRSIEQTAIPREAAVTAAPVPVVKERKPIRLPVVAGILSIIAGVVGIVFPIVVGGQPWYMMIPSYYQAFAPSAYYTMMNPFFWLSVAAGLVALAGGIQALRRKLWPLGLTGAICSIIAFLPLGIPSLLLIIISRREFRQGV
jgi:hypothetical protein